VNKDKRKTVRRLAAATIGALSVGVLLCLPGSADSSGGGGDATVARIGSQTIATASATPARSDNTMTTSDSGTGAVAFENGDATASSFIESSSLVSRARTVITGVDLFDGRITADEVNVVAVAAAGASSATAQTTGSSVTGLAIDGSAVSTSDGPFTIAGLGELSVLVDQVDQGSRAASAHVLGLRLVLSTAQDGLAVGTVIVIGDASAAADRTTLESLTGTPSPSPSPTATHSATPKPTPTPTRTPSQTPVPQPTYTSSTPTYPASEPSGMSDPPPPSAEILARFPGAVFPVVGHYNYVDTFGVVRWTGNAHQGNDIFAAYGSPIVAVQDGTMTSVSTYGIGGNNLHLTNDRGDYFYYAHLSRFADGLHEGQRVKAGQTIGYVGTTGDAQGTSPHLHFEIHPGGGDAIDPYPYLNAWRSAGSEVATATDANGQPVSSAYDSSVPVPTDLAKKSSTADPSLNTAVDQIALGLAAIDAGLANGRAPGKGEQGPAETALVIFNALGVIALKRLKLAAILL
jgi:murein DD-endopeptidase MepM/ murein hydrolase activator NlpD